LVENEDGAKRTLEVDVSEEGRLGFYYKSLLTPSIYKYTFAEAIPKGVVDAFSVITVQLKAFNKIFKGEVSASKSLSGPIGIAKFFGGTWNWIKFWTITGMLSMVLAFMNLLPIPALDGGHVVFLTYEIVSGRPPSDSFLEASQKVGMVLLLCLMVFAFGNDIYKLFLP
ncbi:MAG: M50 family metallopeptidase, partial [Bacteroidota bacterium]